MIEKMKDCCIESYALGIVHGSKRAVGGMIEDVKNSFLPVPTKNKLLQLLEKHNVDVSSSMAESGELNGNELGE